MQEMQEMKAQSWGQEDPWRRKWQSTSVFLPGEFHGQRSLVGYNLQVCKKSEWVYTHTHIPQRLFLIGDPGQHIESGVCSLSHISWEGRISQLELTPNFTCCLWSSSGSPDYLGPVDWQQRGCVTFWPKQLGASRTPPPLSPCHTETVEATISRQCSSKMKEECPACIRFSLSKKEILSWG